MATVFYSTKPPGSTGEPQRSYAVEMTPATTSAKVITVTVKDATGKPVEEKGAVDVVDCPTAVAFVRTRFKDDPAIVQQSPLSAVCPMPKVDSRKLGVTVGGRKPATPAHTKSHPDAQRYYRVEAALRGIDGSQPTGEWTADLQRALDNAGFHVKIDGKLGPETGRALINCLRQNPTLDPTGEMCRFLATNPWDIKVGPLPPVLGNGNLAANLRSTIEWKREYPARLAELTEVLEAADKLRNGEIAELLNALSERDGRVVWSNWKETQAWRDHEGDKLLARMKAHVEAIEHAAGDFEEGLYGETLALCRKALTELEIYHSQKLGLDPMPAPDAPNEDREALELIAQR